MLDTSGAIGSMLDAILPTEKLLDPREIAGSTPQVLIGSCEDCEGIAVLKIRASGN